MLSAVDWYHYLYCTTNRDPPTFVVIVIARSHFSNILVDDATVFDSL